MIEIAFKILLKHVILGFFKIKTNASIIIK